jgi:glycosyltransferase involved in cell wall biosynthesis
MEIRRAASKYFDIVIAHGEAAKLRLMREIGIDADKIALMRHGTYKDRYPDNIDRESARRHFNLAPDDFTLLCLGNMRGYKGIVPMIHAFTRLRAERKNIRLLLAGRILEDEIRDQIAETVSKVGGITFHPHFVADDQIQLFMNAADAFVLPYERVLTSGAALLAISFNKPVLAPSLGVLPEYISPAVGQLFSDHSDMLAVLRQWCKAWDEGQWHARYLSQSFDDLNADLSWNRLVAKALPLA